MRTRGFIGATLTALLAIAVEASPGQAAPCVTACADEVAACVSAECQGLKKRPLRRCRHRCKKQLVQDCYADLAVCGATSARRPRPSSGGGGESGGGW